MTGIQGAINLTKKGLEANPNSHWIIGFSGGKDSTAVLKILVAAYRKARVRPAHIDIVYCDTGVENILLDRYVKKLLENLEIEFRDDDLPFRVNILAAPVENRFFVKIVGRGYPPPTNSFRWCTNNLRIRPVAKFIKGAAKGDAIVALGMRRSESAQRDRVITKSGGEVWQDQKEGGRRYRIFLPILDLSLTEVWDTVFVLARPLSVDPNELDHLYRGASGECPIIKPPNAAPCASGRFGCWTCTVVRRDRSAEAMIRKGEEELVPYLEFRNWLAEIRNDSDRRWPRRRSGRPGLGPFNLRARREIFCAVETLETRTGSTILTGEERAQIEKLWMMDVETEKAHYPVAN